MLPRSFYFLRHGETDWNRQSLLQGSTDIPLNDTGRKQAEDVAPRLKDLGIDRIITSSLQRAQKTAEIVNLVLSVPLILEPRLKERGFGVMEGRSYTDNDRMRQEMADSGAEIEENGFPCAPEAESYALFKERVVDGFCDYLSKFEGENILFVTHGGVYRVLTRALLNQFTHSPNSQPFYFERQESGLWAVHEK